MKTLSLQKEIKAMEKMESGWSHTVAECNGTCKQLSGIVKMKHSLDNQEYRIQFAD